jgi:hypothetical protein
MYNPHKAVGVHQKGLTDYHTFCSSRCRHRSLANTIHKIPLGLGSTNGQVYILTVLLYNQHRSDKPPLIHPAYRKDSYCIHTLFTYLQLHIQVANTA